MPDARGQPMNPNQYARDLLARHKVPERQMRNTLVQVLDISYSRAVRKLDSGAWSVDELAALAHHFGESLNSYLEDAPAETGVAAVIEVHGNRLPVRIRLGELVDPKHQKIAAVRIDGELLVKFGQDIDDTDDIPVFSVLSMEYESSMHKTLRVAVLDDEPMIANNIAESLSKSGLDARPFTDEASLAERIDDFDVFILDWVLGRSTSRNLIVKIRGLDPQRHIILLTGKTQTREADEDAIAMMVGKYALDYAQKPLALQVIAEKIRALARPA